MISTMFMEECENCPHFRVTADTIEMDSLSGSIIYDHIITCEHKEKCQTIKKYLKEEMKKNGNY